MKAPYIALMGHPTAGKTEVARILDELYDVVPVDDGRVLREFAIQRLGAKPKDVYTLEGKRTKAYWADGSPMIDARTGEHMLWRHVLGRLGAQLEGLFGEDVMPRIATLGLSPGAVYSFASVRKKQGWFFRNAGGLVVEVRRPGVGPSGNDFDLYDPTAAQLVLDNDGDLDALAKTVRRVLGPYVSAYSFDVVAG